MGLMFKYPDRYDNFAEFLTNHGWTQKRIREETKIGTRTYYGLRSDEIPGRKGIEEICKMLKKQPGYFLQYVPDDLEEK